MVIKSGNILENNCIGYQSMEVRCASGLWGAVVGVGVMLIAAGQLPPLPQPAPAASSRELPGHFLFKPYFVFSVSSSPAVVVVGDRMAKR